MLVCDLGRLCVCVSLDLGRCVCWFVIWVGVCVGL